MNADMTWGIVLVEAKVFVDPEVRVFHCDRLLHMLQVVDLDLRIHLIFSVQELHTD